MNAPRPLAILGCLILLAAACQGEQPPEPIKKSEGPADRDGDGLLDSLDCDDGDPRVTQPATWYADADGDGYGDQQATATACQRPEGYVDNADDCDEASADIHPGASELCDGIDNDCDGHIDEEAVDPSTWYADVDGDGYGDPDQPLRACELPEYAADNAGDCDDSEPAAWFGADELCDGIDNDCDGGVDENAVDAPTWHFDADRDGQGGSETRQSCEQPEGYVENADDCDDGEAGAYVGAAEVCDGIDNDCDGSVDDGALDAPSWYADTDGDGYGDPDSSAVACDAPSGHVANHDDCDDSEPAAYSGADELCDGVDNDCDGGVDVDAVDARTWYADADGDGFGDASTTTYDCVHPLGYATNDEDCDDGDAAINPWAEEVCGDATDEDCDGWTVCVTSLSAADLKLVGEAAYDYAGSAVSSAGDVNADGYADLLVGAQAHDGGGSAAGAAYLVLGASSVAASGTLALASSAALLVGGTGSLAGYALAGVGDTEGDGYDDVLVGAYTANYQGVGVGAAYLLRGPLSGEVDLQQADAALYGENSGDYAGSAVSGAGDVNGDGLADLLVGARLEDGGGVYAGAAYLVLGSASGALVLGGASEAKYMGSSGDECGTSLAGVGDTDGDGLDDLLIGAPKNDQVASNAGAAYLVLGPASCSGSVAVAAQAELMGERSADYAGLAVAGAGDVDADGYADLLVGAPEEDAGGGNAGAAYLLLSPLSGSLSLSSAHAKLTGSSASDRAGYAVAGAGDVDGDGHDDLLVGAIYEDTGGNTAGAAYLVLGPVSGENDLGAADFMFTGDSSGDQAGWAVAGAGDADGDGCDDLLVGANSDDDGGSAAGAAYLILATSLAL